MARHRGFAAGSQDGGKSGRLVAGISPAAHVGAAGLLLMTAFWWGLFALFGIPPDKGFIGIGIFFAVHFIIMAVPVAMRKSDANTAA